MRIDTHDDNDRAAREVWVHAIDLDNGASFKDIPAPVLTRLLQDITGAWASRGTDKDLIGRVNDHAELSFGDMEARTPVHISGSLADLACWATGRGTAGVTASQNGSIIAVTPVAPTWI